MLAEHQMTAAQYERAVRERFVSLFPEPQYRVTGGPTTFASGRISRVKRQVDVAVQEITGPAEWFFVADAKRSGRKITVPQVESFIGFLQDIGCQRGIIASLLGGTRGAMRRAAAGGAELYVVSYDEALLFDWSRIAANLYPWDLTFHPVLESAMALLNRGRVDEFIEQIDPLPYDEWRSIFTGAPPTVRAAAARSLRTIAESHPDSAWRFNAVQILCDSDSALVHRPWLERLQSKETDAENLDQLKELLGGNSSQ